MSEGTQHNGGFVNGRCYAEKAPEDGPPLYHNGDFHFQGPSRIRSTSSWLADTEIPSSPCKVMLHPWAVLR